jgi:hypothetical protein
MNEYGALVDDDTGGPKYSDKNLPQCHLSTTNPTLPGQGFNLDRQVTVSVMELPKNRRGVATQ